MLAPAATAIQDAGLTLARLQAVALDLWGPARSASQR